MQVGQGHLHDACGWKFTRVGQAGWGLMCVYARFMQVTTCCCAERWYVWVIAFVTSSGHCNNLLLCWKMVCVGDCNSGGW